jgi:hypothetical protein
MPDTAYDPDGRKHHVAVNLHGDVCYKGPNGNWYPISKETWHKAQSGASITISPAGEICITWTQADGDAVHIWTKGVDSADPWAIARIGASYK